MVGYYLIKPQHIPSMVLYGTLYLSPNTFYEYINIHTLNITDRKIYLVAHSIFQRRRHELSQAGGGWAKLNIKISGQILSFN